MTLVVDSNGNNVYAGLDRVIVGIEAVVVPPAPTPTVTITVSTGGAWGRRLRHLRRWWWERPAAAVRRRLFPPPPYVEAPDDDSGMPLPSDPPLSFIPPLEPMLSGDNVPALATVVAKTRAQRDDDDLETLVLLDAA